MNYCDGRVWFTQMCVYRFFVPLLIRLAHDDVEMNPWPCYPVDCSKTVTADYHQGDVSLFGMSAGKQCVATEMFFLRCFT